MSMLLERAQPASNGAINRGRAGVLAEADSAPPDPFADVKERVYQRMLRDLDPNKLTQRDKHEVRPEIESMAASLLAMDDVPMAREERMACASDIADEILGFGPIEPLLEDANVTEVMINGPRKVFFEQGGVLHLSDRVFRDDDHIMRIIEKIVVPINRRIDESSPMVDARLPDGSRVNAIIPPLSVDGPTVTIRKFARDPFTVADLVSFGTLIPEMIDFLQACIKTRLNTIVSGGTGSGKTTLLNVLSSFIPGNERVVTIEDAAELRLRQKHVISLEKRPANIEGTGEVPIRQLVVNSLRMRPDRIVVGEVRGSEALDMLQAMNTGHDGSMTTLHSNGPRDTLARLETMVMMG